MKSKWIVSVLIAAVCLGLVGCQTEKTEGPAACGHEKYLALIDSLEAGDYVSARRMIDAMEGDMTAEPESLDVEDMATIITQPIQQTEAPNGAVVELDIRNFTDYFEIREDLIFESPVMCYQSIQLREAYRGASIQNVNVEVSFFDSHAYGELDQDDQLFFPEHYQMVTGELALKNVEIGNNGEGFLSLSRYSNGCFMNYMMDIAITEVSGSLTLKAE